MAAGGGELGACSAGVGDGYGGGSGEADGGGVAEEFGAGLGVVGVGSELAEGGAGEHEEVVLGEDVVHAGAEGGVALAEGGELAGVMDSPQARRWAMAGSKTEKSVCGRCGLARAMAARFAR